MTSRLANDVVIMSVLPKNPLWKIVRIKQPQEFLKLLLAEILHIVWWDILFWATVYNSWMNTTGTRLFISFDIKPWCSTLSNALLASNDTQKTLLPLCTKYLTDSLNVNKAWLQLLCLLKPYWRSSVINQCSKTDEKTFSNNLDKVHGTCPLSMHRHVYFF